MGPWQDAQQSPLHLEAQSLHFTYTGRPKRREKKQKEGTQRVSSGIYLGKNPGAPAWSLGSTVALEGNPIAVWCPRLCIFYQRFQLILERCSCCCSSFEKKWSQSDPNAQSSVLSIMLYNRIDEKPSNFCQRHYYSQYLPKALRT